MSSSSPSRPITLEQARRLYPRRFTMQYVPRWATQRRECGGFYAPQYRSDAEWYERTKFPGEGDVPRRSPYCESNAPTWPLGQRLEQPFRVTQ